MSGNAALPTTAEMTGDSADVTGFADSDTDATGGAASESVGDFWSGFCGYCRFRREWDGDI